MNCGKCNKPNRDSARYCKWCGSPLPSSTAAGDVLDDLVDKDEIRKRLRDIAAKAACKAEFCRRNGIKERMQLSFVISGDAGTGKTFVAHAIAAILHKAGVVRTPVPEVVNPIEYDVWIKDIDKHVKRLANTVLIVEEAQKLVPDGEAEDIADLDYILQPARRWREQGDMPVLVITGNRRLRGFFHDNPQSASAVNYFFETDGLSVDGLVEITRRILGSKYRRSLTPEAEAKLKRIYINDLREPRCALGAGGHNAAARAYQADLAAVNADGPIGAELVQGKEFRPKTLPEVMAEFNKYVGVENVKKAVRTIANSIQDDLKAGRPACVKHHYRFLGNPGTGKTTMARLFGEALNALGALPFGHLVEVGKDDLVSKFVSETPSKVKDQFQKAFGGVLFIDEAYQLMNDSHGKDAVDTMMTLLNDYQGKMVCIIAGYTKEMGEFMQINSGLESRFDEVIDFPDYTPEELTEIFRRCVGSAKIPVPLSAEADSQIGKFFQKMYNMRQKGFGNARAVVKAYTKAVERMHDRLAADPSSGYCLTMADIEGEDPSKAASVEDILAGLDDLVGMEQVKEQLADIANSVRADRLRQEMGDADAEINDIHIAITGNPGTGKTEVAKRLGKIFKAMGVLPKGHVVARERKTLLDSMANSAGVNMDKAVDEAMGGVLFIDEAYNLIPMNNPSDKDRDGTAAVEALMTRMSNDAGKFVTVIAGYKAEIDEFIENANPGLSRRFTNRIHIEDYTAEQLQEIFLRAAGKKKFRFTDDALALLQRKIQEMVTMKPRNFGNAGAMIQLLNDTKKRHDRRLAVEKNYTAEALFTIEASDIPYNPPKKVDIAQCMKDLDKLVGLKKVKEAVHRLADAIVTEQQVASIDGRRPKVPLHHYLFIGNPGTGKTTVARIMGNIFYSLGLLPSNKVLEVTPTELVAPFVGQTGDKTVQMFERGMGGVFFIDEAYGLKDSSFGQESTRQLLTLLNDNEGKVVCIAAGYPREMGQWMDTNNGIQRRFKEVILFEDYDADELCRIFVNIMKSDGKSLDAGAEAEMHNYFEEVVYNKSENFGNAAEAVTYYEKVKINQGARLRSEMEKPGFDRSELYILRREDMILR